MAKPNPWSGIKLFGVQCPIDGRWIRLHEIWYHHHILSRKNEIGWLKEPLEEIKRAILEAEEIRKPDYSPRPLYIGPPIGGIGMCADYCLHVAVQPEKPDKGVIFTVMMRKAFG